MHPGACLTTVRAHQAPVSSIAVDPSGLVFASTGKGCVLPCVLLRGCSLAGPMKHHPSSSAAHDGSVRWWSVGDQTCTQEHMVSGVCAATLSLSPPLIEACPVVLWPGTSQEMG